MEHPSIARDVEPRARGSRTEVANASRRNGENYSFVLCVSMKRMLTLMHLSMSITRFIGNGIGSNV